MSGSFTMTLLAALGAVTVARAESFERKVWSFTGDMDGSQPRGNLLAASTNALYGTTSSGGINQSGTVFCVNPHDSANPETTIYNFSGGIDGSLPSAGLIQDSAGNLYGTAARDGAHNAGTVFKLTPPANGQTIWTDTTIWSFTGGTDGAQPIGTLLADRSGSGVLYGTTNFGGEDGVGVVFSLTPPATQAGAWTEQVLWNFRPENGGSKPAAALVQDAGGNLYGTASAGGLYGGGVVFQLSPPADGSSQWSENVLHAFTGGGDGATPMATLTLDPTGALFGTTEFGGEGDCAQARFPYYPKTPESHSIYAFNADYVPLGGNMCGTVFKLTPPAQKGQEWVLSVIWSFQAGVDGGNPVGDLILDQNGALRGMTPEYGDAGPNAVGQYGDRGNIFLLTPPSQSGAGYSETTTLTFHENVIGIYERNGLTLGKDGLYYGTQIFGGSAWRHALVYGYGSVFSTN